MEHDDLSRRPRARAEPNPIPPFVHAMRQAARETDAARRPARPELAVPDRVPPFVHVPRTAVMDPAPNIEHVENYRRRRREPEHAYRTEYETRNEFRADARVPGGAGLAPAVTYPAALDEYSSDDSVAPASKLPRYISTPRSGRERQRPVMVEAGGHRLADPFIYGDFDQTGNIPRRIPRRLGVQPPYQDNFQTNLVADNPLTAIIAVPIPRAALDIRIAEVYAHKGSAQAGFSGNDRDRYNFNPNRADPVGADTEENIRAYAAATTAKGREIWGSYVPAMIRGLFGNPLKIQVNSEELAQAYANVRLYNRPIPIPLTEFIAAAPGSWAGSRSGEEFHQVLPIYAFRGNTPEMTDIYMNWFMATHIIGHTPEVRQTYLQLIAWDKCQEAVTVMPTIAELIVYMDVNNYVSSIFPTPPTYPNWCKNGQIFLLMWIMLKEGLDFQSCIARIMADFSRSRDIKKVRASETARLATERNTLNIRRSDDEARAIAIKRSEDEARGAALAASLNGMGLDDDNLAGLSDYELRIDEMFRDRLSRYDQAKKHGQRQAE